jgi:hypothetical protein
MVKEFDLGILRRVGFLKTDGKRPAYRCYCVSALSQEPDDTVQLVVPITKSPGGRLLAARKAK